MLLHWGNILGLVLHVLKLVWAATDDGRSVRSDKERKQKHYSCNISPHLHISPLANSSCQSIIHRPSASSPSPSPPLSLLPPTNELIVDVNMRRSDLKRSKPKHCVIWACGEIATEAARSRVAVYSTRYIKYLCVWRRIHFPVSTFRFDGWSLRPEA